jgi:hypothetical protein
MASVLVQRFFGLPVKPGFELSRGKTLAKFFENSLGIGNDGREEVCAATACRRAGGVQ